MKNNICYDIIQEIKNSWRKYDMNDVVLISEKMLTVICVLSVIIYIFILKNKKNTSKQSKASLIIFLLFIVSITALYYLQMIFNPYHVLTVIWVIFSVISIFVLKKLDLYDEKYGTIVSILTVLVVQISYVSYTPYYMRQHDSRDFYNYQNGGHFGYIGYIFSNGKLPVGSPKDFWCFFNPPLFYIISTVFIKIQNLAGLSIDLCFENLQILSVLYTTVFNIYVYRILKEMNVKKSLIFVLLFVGLSPAMIIMSGSLNNDILSIMLATMAIFYTIKWYKSDKLKDLLKIAITISLSIMTKISTALVAVAIAFVFLFKVINNKEQLKKYIKHFTLFAIIALPIGLWFPIKNLVLYDIPITYVQSVDEDNDANISEHNILERFFTFSQEQVHTVNVLMSKENADYNLFISTLKSFIVDEQIEYSSNSILKIVVPAIFYCSIIISFFYIINLIYILKNYKKINNNWILFFLFLFILQIVSYLKFCFDYPFTFTMNFRYIVPTLVSYAVITGIASDDNKKLFYINSSLLSIFSILSILMFTNML